MIYARVTSPKPMQMLGRFGSSCGSGDIEQSIKAVIFWGGQQGDV
jgi:hypothetical protein